MIYKATQKVIRVGDSLAVTIPAKDVRSAGVKPGDEVDFSFQPKPKEASKITQLDVEYQAFKQQYEQTLKNLAKR